MTPPWTCPGCGAAVATPFCPTCGERPVSPFDQTARGMLAQLVKVVGGIDGRLVRSLRRLIASPGFLTEAHGRGLRKPFIGPFQLFVFANVVFFAAQSLTHINVLSSPLESHLQRQDWRDYAQQRVAERLRAKGTTLERYAPVFDRAVAFNAKALVFLTALPFAALLPFVFYRQRRPFLTHVVFALHAYAFLLLLFCAGLLVAAIDRSAGGSGLDSPRMDNILTALNLGIFGTYLYLAAGRAYGVAGWSRGLAALALALAAGFIMLGYRFVVFLITLATA